MLVSEKARKFHEEESEKAYKRASSFAMEVDIRNQRIGLLLEKIEDMTQANAEIAAQASRLDKERQKAIDMLVEVNGRLQVLRDNTRTLLNSRDAIQTVEERVTWMLRSESSK